MAARELGGSELGGSEAADSEPRAPQYDRRLSACPFCESPQLQFHDRDYNGAVVQRCEACALLMMNPQYSADYLRRYYATYYQPQDEGGVRLGDPQAMPRQAAAKTARLSWIESHCTPGRLLSIGCGTALELVLAAQRGWDVTGFDIDPQVIASLRTQTDLPLHTGDDLCDLQLPADDFDCVFMDQVLEHPQRPQDYLREARRILRPGGLLFIGCPNIGSLANQWKTALGRCGLQRRRGRHYAMDHHLFFYTPAALSRQLEHRFGYRVLGVRGDPGNGNSASRLGPWFDAVANRFRRRWPVLDSTFCLLAQKQLDRGFA